MQAQTALAMTKPGPECLVLGALIGWRLISGGAKPVLPRLVRLK